MNFFSLPKLPSSPVVGRSHHYVRVLGALIVLFLEGTFKGLLE